MKTDYRKIWEKANGSIPFNKCGRTYEIHHIDGNHNNNDISNLNCISIEEHYRIHMEMKDWWGAALIAKRMNLPKDHISKLQLGKKRPGIGGVKKGTIPWNKGKKNCFSKEVVEAIRNGNKKRVGERQSGAKISEEQVIKIRTLYDKKPKIIGVGKIQKNGIIMSYIQAFCKKYCFEYGVTDTCLKHIITRKTWRHVK